MTTIESALKLAELQFPMGGRTDALNRNDSKDTSIYAGLAGTCSHDTCLGLTLGPGMVFNRDFGQVTNR